MHTETIDMLATRRSAFAADLVGPGPTPNELERLLTLATRVPDHGKLAPWRFILFEGAAQQRAGAIISEVYAVRNPEMDEPRIAAETKRLAFAPLVVGVVSRAAPHAKIPEWEQLMSAGAVCMNMLVAAQAMGFSSVWLTEWYAYDRDVLTRLGLAPHEKMAGFIHIGRLPKPRDDRPRPALAELVTHFGA